MPSQLNRSVKIHGPHAEDEILFRRMTSRDALGELYEFELEFYCMDESLEFESFLGEFFSIEIATTGEARYFSGYATRVEQLLSGDAASKTFSLFSMSLRPWTWFLTRVADCKVYQNQSIVDTAKEIFEKHGFSDFDDRLRGTYPSREYCVQYRETDFNFVSRLFEDAGIYYFFEHEEDKHVLVLVDDSIAHEPVEGYEEVLYFPPLETEVRARDHLTHWRIKKQIEPNAYALEDYDYLKSATELKVDDVNTPVDHAKGDLEIFEYPGPGTYKTAADGKALAKLRLEEMRVRYERLEGKGNAHGMETGAVFELKGFPRDDQNRKYLIVATAYRVLCNAYESTFTESGEHDVSPLDLEGNWNAHVACELEAIDHEAIFRPQRRARRPVMPGPQTATVVGPSGDEIHTDTHARVKVQFHWDRYGERDENSSCWVRVSQQWAGKGWGAMQIPRIGQEVIVDFLEGNPDHPLVTGRVYNDVQTIPFEQPTQSGIKSRSTSKGDVKTFNELRFEDKKGAEEIYFHAEKDFTRIVENNDVLKIGFDDKDAGDRTVDIYNSRSVTLHKGDDKLVVDKGDRAVQIKTGGDKLEVKQDLAVIIAMGDYSMDIKAGQGTVKAMKSLLLKVGGSSIKIEPMKITIKSPNVDIKGDMTFKATGGITADLKGGAMASVKGGIVKIN